MTNETIKQEIVNLVCGIFKNQQIDTDTIEYVNLVEDCGMDSLKFVSIIVAIEDRFQIVVPDDMLLVERFDCIEKIVLIVRDEVDRRGGYDNVET